MMMKREAHWFPVNAISTNYFDIMMLLKSKFATGATMF
jgi:hypothetical protein